MAEQPKITFHGMTFLMLVGRMPTPGETRMTDALLTVLVEHGMTSSAISARLIYHTAPRAVVRSYAEKNRRIPGIGHRTHYRAPLHDDPGAAGLRDCRR